MPSARWHPGRQNERHRRGGEVVELAHRTGRRGAGDRACEADRGERGGPAGGLLGLGREEGLLVDGGLGGRDRRIERHFACVKMLKESALRARALLVVWANRASLREFGRWDERLCLVMFAARMPGSLELALVLFCLASTKHAASSRIFGDKETHHTP